MVHLNTRPAKVHVVLAALAVTPAVVMWIAGGLPRRSAVVAENSMSSTAFSSQPGVIVEEFDPDTFPTKEELRAEYEGLILSASPDCDVIRRAVDVGVMGSYGIVEGWDVLLLEAAKRAGMSGCLHNATMHVESVAVGTNDMLIKADATLWLAQHSPSQSDEDNVKAVSLFDSCLGLLDRVSESSSSNVIRVAALNWKANALSRLGKTSDAAKVHAEAVAISRRSSGDRAGERLLLLNQARLHSEAGDLVAASSTYGELLAMKPATMSEVVEHLRGCQHLYRAGEKAGDAGPGIAALESSWADPTMMMAPEIVWVGFDLLSTRKKSVGPASSCDLAVELLSVMDDKRETWLQGASNDSERAVIERDLRDVESTCISMLQSYILHGKREYLDLAYMRLVDGASDEATRESWVRQWGRELKSFERWLGGN
jgi:hypothetical protein